LKNISILGRLSASFTQCKQSEPFLLKIREIDLGPWFEPAGKWGIRLFGSLGTDIVKVNAGQCRAAMDQGAQFAFNPSLGR